MAKPERRNMTPGPWERYGYIGHSGLTKIRASTGKDRTGRDIYVDIPACNEDTILMAAAPELADCLRDLFDIQNGPPLIRDTEKWEEIMKRASRILKMIES